MGEWVKWHGHVSLQPSDNHVDITLRDGGVMHDINPAECDWKSRGADSDIVSWRYHTPEKKNSGLSASYYRVNVDDPVSGGVPYTAECQDVIEALNMTASEANIFKAVWRSCAERMGNGKPNYQGAVYDAEKMCFFSGRVLVKAKKDNK